MVASLLSQNQKKDSLAVYGTEKQGLECKICAPLKVNKIFTATLNDQYRNYWSHKWSRNQFSRT